jgi:hypothetical protein
VTASVDLLIIERGGVRLGVPAARISAVADLPRREAGAHLQRRLGQPPPADGERCFGLRVEMPGGVAVVDVAGRVSVATVAAAEIAALPSLFAGAAALIVAVVFAEAPVLVLDPDAMVAHARAVP